MTAVIAYHPAPVAAAIARVRAEARRAVLDPHLPPTQRELCWMIMRGARNPKYRRNQVNHGAPCPQLGWWRMAEVISGAEPWASNDGDVA